MDYGFAQFSHRLIYARAVKTHIITSNHHQVVKEFMNLEKKNFVSKPQHLHQHRRQTERNEAKRKLSEQNDFSARHVVVLF